MSRPKPATSFLNYFDPLTEGITTSFPFFAGELLAVDFVSGIYFDNRFAIANSPIGAAVACTGVFARAPIGLNWSSNKPTWSVAFGAYVNNWAVAPNNYEWIVWSNESANSYTHISHKISIGGGAAGTNQQLLILTGQPNNTIASGVNLSLSTWYDIVMTCDGTTATFYVNGAVQAALAFAHTPTLQTDRWVLSGGSSNDSTYVSKFDGNLSYLHFWNARCLNASDVAALASDPLRMYRRRPAFLSATAAYTTAASAIPFYYDLD